MEEITQRQKLLLLNLIQEYIQKPKPVSSFMLFKKIKGTFSPATIRNEMACLTKKGYLKKDFFSSGRKPTDKAYRFFVDCISENLNKRRFSLKRKELNFSFNENIFSLIRETTKRLVFLTHLFALSFLKEEEIIFKEGWEKISRLPEFEEKNFLKELARFSDDFENLFNKVFEKIEENSFDLKVYIGQENPFGSFRHLAFFSSVFPLPSNKKSFFLLVGPKRINYEKSIFWLKTFRDFFKEKYDKSR